LPQIFCYAYRAGPAIRKYIVSVGRNRGEIFFRNSIHIIYSVAFNPASVLPFDKREDIPWFIASYYCQTGFQLQQSADLLYAKPLNLELYELMNPVQMFSLVTEYAYIKLSPDPYTT
jgi:hypothetical protein